MPEEAYQFDERTYHNLARAGITARSVLDVLHRHPQVRRHIGATLQIFGQDGAGMWLAVALVEVDDDQYLVSSARALDDDEAAAVRQVRTMLGEEQQ